MALPCEIPQNEYDSLVREYCNEQFVSKGMIVDYAVHDKRTDAEFAEIELIPDFDF